MYVRYVTCWSLIRDSSVTGFVEWDIGVHLILLIIDWFRAHCITLLRSHVILMLFICKTPNCSIYGTKKPENYSRKLSQRACSHFHLWYIKSMHFSCRPDVLFVQMCVISILYNHFYCITAFLHFSLQRGNGCWVSRLFTECIKYCNCLTEMS